MATSRSIPPPGSTAARRPPPPCSTTTTTSCSCAVHRPRHDAGGARPMCKPIRPKPGRPRQSLTLAAWPEADRTAWQQALQVGDVLDPGGAAAGWAPSTRAGASAAYGRWLAHLAATQQLDPALGPADRVTPEAIGPYVADLQAKHAATSVAAYLAFLVCALKAMAPECDWRWLQGIVARLSRPRHPPATSGRR